MMIIVRVYPKGDLKESWEKIVQNPTTISGECCMPLYISRQEKGDFMSIIYHIGEIDEFTDILVRKIPLITNPEMTRTVTLLGPRFFPAPKDRPRQLERYQVSLRVASEEVANVFDNTSRLKYPNDVFPTYGAYSFGENDILFSMLSTGREKIEAFVRDHIASQQGVRAIETTHIVISKRLAPEEMWREYRRNRYQFKPYDGYEEYDFVQEALLSGAFASEVT